MDIHITSVFAVRWCVYCSIYSTVCVCLCVFSRRREKHILFPLLTSKFSEGLNFMSF